MGSEVATAWTSNLTPAHSGYTTCCPQQWCDPGNCHLHPHIGSVYPDKFAYGVLSVPVWVFVRPAWGKLCDITVLPSLFPCLSVITAEMHHLSLHCAHILCLVFISVQQASVNDNGYNFFHMEEFSDTLFLHIHFDMYMRNATVSDCFSAATCCMATKLNGLLWKGSVSTAIPPTFTSDIVDQLNKI